jgi:hypothetical protein
VRVRQDADFHRCSFLEPQGLSSLPFHRFESESTGPAGIGGVNFNWLARRIGLLNRDPVPGAARGPLPGDTGGPSQGRPGRPAERKRSVAGRSPFAVRPGGPPDSLPGFTRVARGGPRCRSRSASNVSSPRPSPSRPNPPIALGSPRPPTAEATLARPPRCITADPSKPRTPVMADPDKGSPNSPMAEARAERSGQDLATRHRRPDRTVLPVSILSAHSFDGLLGT